MLRGHTCAISVDACVRACACVVAQGKHDDGPVRGAMDILCARAGQIATASKQRAEQLGSNFEAPLKEYARTIKSVQVAMADRAAALSAFSQVSPPAGKAGRGEKGGRAQRRVAGSL